MSNVPADLKYTKSHEWVRLEGDGSVTVGELKRRSAELVRRRDIDKDGALSADELRQRRAIAKAG